MKTDNFGPEGTIMIDNCYHSSIESSSSTWQNCETADQVNHFSAPDFSQIYSFVGSLFDPSTSGHLLKLKEMDPIDVQTVLMLMRNLTVNLANPDFENHRRILSSAEVPFRKWEDDALKNTYKAGETYNASLMVKAEQY